LICWQDFSSKPEIKKVKRGAEKQGTSAQGKDDAGNKLTKKKKENNLHLSSSPWPIQLL
jgi:hypothetical protein